MTHNSHHFSAYKNEFNNTDRRLFEDERAEIYENLRQQAKEKQNEAEELY